MLASQICSCLQSQLPEGSVRLHQASAGESWLELTREVFSQAMRILREESSLAFDHLRLITAVDSYSPDNSSPDNSSPGSSSHFSVVYHLTSYQYLHSICIHVDVPRDDPRIDSLCAIWPGADWQEREAFDMMGIEFLGHPNLQRILLPLDWEGHPLRKDYSMPSEYHGIKHG